MCNIIESGQFFVCFILILVVMNHPYCFSYNDAISFSLLGVIFYVYILVLVINILTIVINQCLSSIIVQQRWLYSQE